MTIMQRSCSSIGVGQCEAIRPTLNLLIISALFPIAYFFNVLASTWVFHENELLYWAKHLSIFTLAAVTIISLGLKISLTLKVRISCSALVVLSSTWAYLLHGKEGLFLFGQVVIVLAASAAICQLWRSGVLFRLRWMFVAIAALPLCLDYLFDGGRFIYSSYYGRGRLLLGYWHPKEAGIAVLFAVMIWRLRSSTKFKRSDILITMLLWLIQSRTGLLFYINYLLVSWMLGRFSMKRTLLTLCLIYFFVPLCLVFSFRNELDVLASNRLTFWTDVADLYVSNNNLDITGSDPGTSIVHMDNFYLEYYLKAGAVGTLSLISILFGLVLYLGKSKFCGTYVNALFVPFLIYCFLDAGLFSTGNFLNFLVFPVILTRSFSSRGLQL